MKCHRTFGRIVLLLIHLMFLTSLSAQQDFLQGKLLDAQTGDPVVFATIQVKGWAKGVISNQDGSFRIPKRFKELGDSLIISSMGYEKREIPIEEFSLEDLTIISLKPGVMTLSEAVVSAKKRRPLSARSIVRKAIRAIPKNFPLRPFSTIGYYRDYQYEKQDYVNLNEAILEVFDKGFDNNDHRTTAVRIYDYLKNQNFPRDTSAQKPYDYQDRNKVIDHAFLGDYGGNEFTILRIHDAIRNHDMSAYSFVNQLDSDLLDNHKFSREPETSLGDESIYSIKFTKSIPGYKAYEAIGRLYISTKDFAIHKMEYALFVKSDKTLSAGNQNTDKTQLLFEVVTEYHRNNKVMFLNYISFQNSFEIREPPKLKVDFVYVDNSRKCFAVAFNKEPDLKNALLDDNFTVRFKGKKIDIKKIDVNMLNKKEILLFPKMYPNKVDAMFREIDVVARKKEIGPKLLRVDVKNIRDIEGNLVGQSTYRNYNQFREFFVQQVKPNNPTPIASLFMKKDKPIFEDQPILKPDNFKDYWMNTPLQKAEK